MIERMLESWAEGETPASVLRMQTNSEHLLTMRDQPEDYARLVGTFSSTRPQLRASKGAACMVRNSREKSWLAATTCP